MYHKFLKERRRLQKVHAEKKFQASRELAELYKRVIKRNVQQLVKRL